MWGFAACLNVSFVDQHKTKQATWKHHLELNPLADISNILLMYVMDVSYPFTLSPAFPASSREATGRSPRKELIIDMTVLH